MAARKYLLFLHGAFERRAVPFYKKLCRGRTLVAVDGGYRFFQLSKIIPDTLIGDFDSIKLMPDRLNDDIEIVTFPTRKDQTDGELALTYALDQGATDVLIVMPEIGEPDHFVGNLMLLTLPLRRRKRSLVRIVNDTLDIRLLNNESETIRDRRGDLVSVVPLSSSILLSWTGTDFNVNRARIGLGQTVGLRNRISAARAVVKVEGKALLIRQLSGRAR